MLQEDLQSYLLRGGDAMKAAEVRHILDTIGGMFPDAHCELNHSNAFELTIAVLLSAQCTDATVNKVTEDLFPEVQGSDRLYLSTAGRAGAGYPADWSIPQQGQAYSEPLRNPD